MEDVAPPAVQAFLEEGPGPEHAYYRQHHHVLQRALSRAISDAVQRQVDDPLRFVGGSLVAQAPLESATVRSLRRFLRDSACAVAAAQEALDALQTSAHPTSRVGYLRSLQEMVGPDPRQGAPGRHHWQEEWRSMYLEYQQTQAEPAPGAGAGVGAGEGPPMASRAGAAASGVGARAGAGVEASSAQTDWGGVEQHFASRFQLSIDVRAAEGWACEAAEAYTWLSSVEVRGPMARALKRYDGRYAASTYALTAALASRAGVGTGPPGGMTYRNLHGKGGLVEEDEAWAKLLVPDANGFCA